MRIILLVLIIAFSITLFAQETQSIEQKINEFYVSKDYKAGAEFLKEQMKKDGENMDLTINIAYFYALDQQSKPALTYLQKSVDLGFNEAKWLNEDQVFTFLKTNKTWKKIIDQAQANYDKEIKSLPEQHQFLAEIALPAVITKGSMSVEECMQNRRSVRAYSDEALSLEEVSQMLWSAYGITKAIAPEHLRGGLKTAPSAGALYPLELYLSVKNVTGLEAGVYYYEPNGHLLKLLKKGDISKELMQACYYQDFVESASANIIYSAIYSRMTVKYGNRGRERYVCMDLGHSAENVYLQAEALGLGTCAIGAFNDLNLQKLIQMTQTEEPLYVMPIGKKLPE